MHREERSRNLERLVNHEGYIRVSIKYYKYICIILIFASMQKRRGGFSLLTGVGFCGFWLKRVKRNAWQREREKESSKSDVSKGFRSWGPPAHPWSTKDPRLSEESLEESREEATQGGLVELHQTATMWMQSVLCILSYTGPILRIYIYIYMYILWTLVERCISRWAQSASQWQLVWTYHYSCHCEAPLRLILK